jgi:hypothetical protein
VPGDAWHLSVAGGIPGFPVEVECSDELHAPFFTEKRIHNSVEGCEAGNRGYPDFLWRLNAPMSFMRLSSRKSAYTTLSRAARKSGIPEGCSTRRMLDWRKK